LSFKATFAGEFKGLILKNDKLRLVILPEFGARRISLIDKSTETEFAWHCPDVPTEKPTYQVEYENVSGFFIVFQRVKPARLREKASSTRRCSLGTMASYRSDKNRDIITVHMERAVHLFPLLIRKRLSPTKNAQKSIWNYDLFNLSDEEIEFHYSGHNIMSISPPYRIVSSYES